MIGKRDKSGRPTSFWRLVSYTNGKKMEVVCCQLFTAVIAIDISDIFKTSTVKTNFISKL